MPESKKISFNIDVDEDGYPPVSVESIWVKPAENDLYEVDSIPFFTREATVGDLIRATSDEKGVLWFEKVEQRSAHSLIRVVFFERDNEHVVIERLREFGCGTERMEQFNLLAVDIPADVPLGAVQDFLHSEASSGHIDYEEALLRQ